MSIDTIELVFWLTQAAGAALVVLAFACHLVPSRASPLLARR